MRCNQRAQTAPVAGAATLLTCTILLTALCPNASASKPRLRQADSEPVPKAGDLVNHVKDGLSKGHSALGKVSAALLSVQTNVDHTEQSMLGKVLDLQTARTLFQRHEEIETTNSNMENDVSTLDATVGRLSVALGKMQRQSLDKALMQRASRNRLRTQIEENEAEIESIRSELAKGHNVQNELERLTQIHKEMMTEAIHAREAGEESEAMLSRLRVTSRKEAFSHNDLRAQLKSMNSYSVSCHADVEKASKMLGIAMAEGSKGDQAAAMILRQKKKAYEAGEQRLVAEHALFVAEVKRNETGEIQEIERLKDLRGDLQMLERSIVSEVRSLETKIIAAKEHVNSLSVALMENSQAEEEDAAKKRTIEAKISELANQLHDNENPIAIATTEVRNNALQIELREAYVLWKNAKTAETAALLNLNQADADVAAKADSLKMAAQAIALAHQESQQKVAQAGHRSAASRADSTVLLEKAQSAIAERCMSNWEALWKKRRLVLLKCKGAKEELAVENAKKKTLMETLEAEAETE